MNSHPGRLLPAAVLWFCALASSASAQSVELGLRGGVNLTTVAATDADAFRPGWRWGPVGGAFATVRLPGPVDLQAEALYSVKGAQAADEGVDASLRVDYLELPVLARVSLRGLPREAYAVGGVAFGLRLRARSRIAFEGGFEELDVAEAIESSDTGIVAGGGFTAGPIIVDGRLTWGLRDVDRSPAARVRHRAVSVTAGIKF